MTHEIAVQLRAIPLEHRYGEICSLIEWNGLHVEVPCMKSGFTGKRGRK
jgi:hypothetical protein